MSCTLQNSALTLVSGLGVWGIKTLSTDNLCQVYTNTKSIYTLVCFVSFFLMDLTILVVSVHLVNILMLFFFVMYKWRDSILSPFSAAKEAWCHEKGASVHP